MEDAPEINNIITIGRHKGLSYRRCAILYPDYANKFCKMASPTEDMKRLMTDALWLAMVRSGKIRLPTRLPA